MGKSIELKLFFDDIPEGLVNAYLAAEDDEFFSHTGIDFTALARALSELIITGEKGSGGGTLTMQVAEIICLPKKKPTKKVKGNLYGLYA